MKDNILIIGSGWLGAPLSVHLSDNGYRVSATTTHETNHRNMDSRVPLLTLDSQKPQQVIATLVSVKPTTMIIAIPPSRDNGDYLASLMVLSNAAVDAHINQVIFISSSSVWGNNTGLVNEQTAMSPTSDSAIAMTKFSQHLQQQKAFRATTLCLTGLFNTQRHPGRFLAGRRDIANPNAVVNMIHQQDCIGLISSLLQQPQWQPLYIGSAPSHPTRRDFYRHGAKILGLTPPQFNLKGGEEGKTVCGKASAMALGYQYSYPDLMAAVNHSQQEIH